MSKRILLVHAYQASAAPIVEAFRKLWPGAEILNILDESLYADVDADGVMGDDVPGRVASLLHHAALSGADGIVFTGATFGSAVEAAKRELTIPVLKADEAMAEKIAAEAKNAAIMCTARRALPVIRANVESTALKLGTRPSLTEIWVAGAKDAIAAGDRPTHDRLIAATVERTVGVDMIAFGQISMAPARALLAPEMARRVVTSAEASAALMRRLVEGR